jgi:hypothetical protein
MVQRFLQKAGAYKMVLTFHVACYIPWYADKFNKNWDIWKDKSGTIKNPRPHRGRPVTDLEPTKRKQLNRLMANRTYHEKMGHTNNVDRINLVIEEIKNKK